MCLISREVETVNNTKIFCGLNANKTKQLTVYANTVNNISDNNAMVLPVPFPHSVNFHDLSNYKKFFEDCEDCFELPVTKSLSRGVTYSMNSVDSFGMKSLKVIDVGSYKVSLAKSLNDLNRVNRNVFDLSEGLANILKRDYSNQHFGFIICKLARGNESYHPFAYSHDIFNQKVFIPTKHYHDDSRRTVDGLLSMYSTFGQNLNNNLNKYKNDNYADDWGHDIYLYNVNIDSNREVKQMDKSRYLWTHENKIKFSKLDFDLDRRCQNFKKVQINGSHPNIDIILSAF